MTEKQMTLQRWLMPGGGLPCLFCTPNAVRAILRMPKTK
jgi:hypothetical protein